jgi:hypothetical protein
LPSSTLSAGTSPETDSTLLVSSLVELTQIALNAHDLLYPSKSRTHSLVKAGDYSQFLDHFLRALDAFRRTWQDKQWADPNLKDIAWCSFHFVRLYVTSFAFQAHVQRATSGYPGSGRPSSSKRPTLFTRGVAASPDALYIYASIDSAQEILSICLRLADSGRNVLGYVPSRYLTHFAYSGTFALKTAYSGVMDLDQAVK